MAWSTKGFQGITGPLKERLIQQGLERRARRSERGLAEDLDANGGDDAIPNRGNGSDESCRFDLDPAYQQLRLVGEGAARLGISNPFFRPHDGIAGNTTVIAGQTYINFSSYNYLGLSGHPLVSAAAKQAIDDYGTSVSASRLVSGERPIHRALEEALARLHGVDDCITFVSGHATNVTTIGVLCGPGDLVLHDSLIHNSILQGIALSKAKRLSFPHNDWAAADRLLSEIRGQFRRVLIIIEGLYGMDGDVPDLPQFILVKLRHHALLMVDEAHSFGVLGARGLGIREHFGVDGGAVDIWMGTLSKALAGCGGYIAGGRVLTELLKCSAPGFVYSVGMAPPLAAASLAALAVLQAEPERVARLRERAQLFFELVKRCRIDVGLSQGLSIVPVITASSIKAARLADALFRRGINVQPIVYPAVNERAARLRFFLSCEHTEDQIRAAVDALAAALRTL
ncbi:aminotransferase class I/II-fold pyridoxal phosphate-dependent enzyme [uncultured Lamprocystis sp.]|jgi:8-amino-7-oxononanoate synthase|uniref:aminotransferase class I/II-fold pyridoxal phosphate-dependent enzyme n=1 Tax=uncultured Lamprocystis sp. TaxID=543132 RepID=UPI0025E90F0E|nr:aminotransferase class I/II-fold pyridoxal phosphate-dependent enzyme [uncultured Lamprocystis sp.]